jgi:hypothetical protein
MRSNDITPRTKASRGLSLNGYARFLTLLAANLLVEFHTQDFSLHLIGLLYFGRSDSGQQTRDAVNRTVCITLALSIQDPLGHTSHKTYNSVGPFLNPPVHGPGSLDSMVVTKTTTWQTFSDVCAVFLRKQVDLYPPLSQVCLRSLDFPLKHGLFARPETS